VIGSRDMFDHDGLEEMLYRSGGKTLGRKSKTESVTWYKYEKGGVLSGYFVYGQHHCDDPSHASTPIFSSSVFVSMYYWLSTALVARFRLHYT
jgi:hypothetical protein